MRVTRGQRIAGVEAVTLRDALRYLRGCEFVAEEVAYRLKQPDDQAGAVVGDLIDAGLVEERRQLPERPAYALTLAGTALANATAAKPVTRAAGGRHLEGLIERAGIVNGSAHYLVWVERIVLFGSYLDDTIGRLGDVDVAIGLMPRDDGEIFIERSQQRVAEAAAAGRRFSSFIDELSWPETEVKLFLKARSPILSFTTTRDRILDQVPSRLVYERLVH